MTSKAAEVTNMSDSITVVNAGFSRKRKGGRGIEWRNVQGIRVLLPESRLADQAFRNAVRSVMPANEGWVLEGYCVQR